jgi:hypothetical protein
MNLELHYYKLSFHLTIIIWNVYFQKRSDRIILQQSRLKSMKNNNFLARCGGLSLGSQEQYKDLTVLQK